MESPQAVKVVEKYQISPPPATVPPTSLPLTFLDIPWFFCVPTKRLFFFEFTHNSDHFTNHVLPKLKHSLSLTLEHFFPLAGHLEFPPLPAKPHLVYREGDSVSLTVVECTGDFNNLTGNQPRDCKDFLPLVAELQSARESSDGSVAYPVMALQVTIFPNYGICISITNRHMIDGHTSSHFMKSWASVCNSGGDISCLKNSLPLYDRSIIKDPKEVLDLYLKQWYESKWKLLDGEIGSTNIDNVRATFSLGQQDIEKMKVWISTRLNNNVPSPLHLSTFSVVIAFVWVCMEKTKNNDDKDDEIKHLVFFADCRNRLEYEVPTTYFGNCLLIPVVKHKKRDLLGKNGVILAAQAIANKVEQVKNELLSGIEDWVSDFLHLYQTYYPAVLAVAGSPRFKLHDLDFGWGRPKKMEMAHIVDSSVVSFGDGKDGGIEIGVTLSKVEIQTFTLIFEQGIRVFCS